MAYGDWVYGLFPPQDDDGNYVKALGGIGPWQISKDGKVITNLVTGTTYDLTAIGGGSDTDTHTDVSDDGTTTVSSVGDINFAADVDVAADGDGTVTVTPADHLRAQVTTVPLTEIASGNTAVGLELQVPSGKTLKIYEVGVITDAETAPAGLKVEVQDLTNAVALVSKNAKHAEGTPTLASKTGAFAASMRINNGDTVTHNASAWIKWALV